ncbi:MAG: TSCPD domain-containing protein [Acetobacteraceae bacterium]|nr:TSCPD domain-containing protein [Acetobacteraceae bacterium]
MRQVTAAGDPDGPTRPVILPASWEDGAAGALAALAPEPGAADLRHAAEGWIARIEAAAARIAPVEHGIGRQLRTLLRLRQGAPGEAIWRHEHRAHGDLAFVLHLPAFVEPGGWFDGDAFEAAVETAVAALTLHDPESRRIAVGMTDLAGLLACLGLDYDSAPARATGAGLAALLRARADAASVRWASILGGGDPVLALPAPPDAPDWLAARIGAAREAASAGRALHAATTAIRRAGAVDALLGAETGGIAPGFAAVSPEGCLTRASRALLAARGRPAEAALAAILAGETPLPVAGRIAHAAMHDAIAPFLHALPPRPVTLEARAAPRAVCSELPSRHTGITQRATVGGHKVFLRTGEYEDGRLGEVAIVLPKEGAVARGLAEGLSQAVSIGLQHGVPLSEFADAFAGLRFGPAGAVEGDPAVTSATSLLDYVARTLAATYLPGHPLPPAEPDEAAQAPARPMELPLGLPDAADSRPRGRALRLVGQ